MDKLETIAGNCSNTLVSPDDKRAQEFQKLQEGVIASHLLQGKLEQLERLRSEDTPAASWLPLLLIHIGSQAKRKQLQIQSQSYKFKEFAKISNF